MRERQHELLSSLHAAIDTLNVCLARIEDLIHQVDRRAATSAEPRDTTGGARVSFGGGASVIRPGENFDDGPRKSSGSGGGSPGSGEGSIRGGEGMPGFPDHPSGTGDRRPGVERRSGDRERRLDAERRVPRPSAGPGHPGMPALMAATEMAHLGYSRDEIAARLRARWGDRAAAILREALD
jgi:hypothetical protein